MMRELSKLLGPLQRRVRLMVTRGVITLVDNDAAIQLLQVKLLAGETRDRVENFQNYGFCSAPLPGAHQVMVSIGGNHDLGFTIAIEDPRYRPTGWPLGDSGVYDFRGQQVHLSSTGIVITGAGLPVTITDTPKVRMECDLEVTGDIKDRCDTAEGRTMSDMRETYDTHNHPGDSGGTTGQPNQTMS